MAEGSERKATRRATAREKAEIVPAGDPEHEVATAEPLATEPLRGPFAMLERARDAITVRRVFGDPIERDGVTVIPAAKVRGGGGGGGDVQGNGGGGFGISASPAGAYVIKNGTVRWEPALDLNRTIFMGQVVGIVALLVIRSAIKAISRRR